MSRSPILLKRGEVFGRLTVIQRTVRCASGGGRLWICRCTCGKTKKVAATSLRDGSVKSCGCLKRDATIARNKAGAIQLQTGLSLRVLSQRLHRGETVEKAITRLPYERVFRVWMRSSYIRNLLRKELAKYTD